MIELRKLLIREYNRLNQIVKISKKNMEKAPEGTLRVAKCNNYFQYYRCSKNDNQGVYLPKGNEELIQRLAQKPYDKKVLQLAEKRRRQIGEILSSYADDEIEQIYYKMHPHKQQLIKPAEPTWEQRLKEWKEKPYVSIGFPKDMAEIYTERGERVRSKSEKILADYFYHHGIEYKYECPLYLKDGVVLHPDFTFLSPITYEEIYWEHNGMMDDPGYSVKAVRKIHTYEDNEIYPGERLILTYETEKIILNTAQIERLVKKHLIR